MTKSRQDEVFDLMMEMIRNEFIFSFPSQLEQERYFGIMRLIGLSRELKMTNKKRHVRRFAIVSGIAFLLDSVTGFSLLHTLLGYKPPIKPKPKRTESTGGR